MGAGDGGCGAGRGGPSPALAGALFSLLTQLDSTAAWAAFSREARLPKRDPLEQQLGDCGGSVP